MLLLAIAVLHITFIRFDVYWTARWVDIPVHILGGVWIVLCAAWILEWIFPAISLSLFEVIMLGLIVGGLWEISEVLLGIVNPLLHGYVTDTVKDIGDDVIGTTLGFFVVSWIGRQEKTKTP